MLPGGFTLLLSLSVGISLNITITPPTCEGDKGIIVVNPSGGTAPYSYSFDGSPPQYSGILAVGDGTVHYQWYNPVSGKMEAKTSFNQKMEDGVLCGVGAYTPQ